MNAFTFQPTNRHALAAVASVLLASALPAFAAVKTVVGHNADAVATARFALGKVPAPSKDDAATTAKFTIVDGTQDSNGGDLDKLHDGKLPGEPDEPTQNFFFDAGTAGGRIRV